MPLPGAMILPAQSLARLTPGVDRRRGEPGGQSAWRSSFCLILSRSWSSYRACLPATAAVSAGACRLLVCSMLQPMPGAPAAENGLPLAWQFAAIASLAVASLAAVSRTAVVPAKHRRWPELVGKLCQAACPVFARQCRRHIRQHPGHETTQPPQLS